MASFASAWQQKEEQDIINTHYLGTSFIYIDISENV